MRTLVNRFKSCEQGSFGLIFAITVLILFVGIGAAYDTAGAEKTKLRLQDAADAAVLAASKSGETSQSSLELTAKSIVDANNFSGSVLNLALSITPGGQIKVIVTGQYTTQIMGIIGRESIPLMVVSQAPLAAHTPMHLALVLDTTGSMNGTKLANLKIAATDLITMLEDNVSNTKVSIVPFAQYVNVGTAAQSWLNRPVSGAWHGCAGSRLAPWHLRSSYSGRKVPGLNTNACGQPVLPLTDDMTSVKSSVDSLSAQGWTYIPAGLMWGWRTLDARAPYTEAATTPSGSVRKVMVLMTDGANTKSKSGTFHTGSTIASANQLTTDLCSEVKIDGVEIYTIAYAVTDVTTKNMLRGCATNTSMYFDASNSALLASAFGQIAESLIKVRLTH